MTDDPRGARPADAFADHPGPPEFPEIEQQLIGLVLVRSKVFDEVADLVSPEHFQEEAFGRMWGVLLEMHRRGVPIGASPAFEPFVEELGWTRAEVGRTVAQLMKTVLTFSPSHAVYLANLIRDIWQRRELFFLGRDVLSWTQGGLDNGAPAIIERLESKIHGLVVTGAAEQERSFTFAEAITTGLDQAHRAAEQHAAGELVGVPTGLGAVDRKLGGLRDTDLVIVASRPGMGKTSFSNRIARAAAERFAQLDPERPQQVMIFSLEMSSDQLAIRQVAAQARVSFERIRLGHCDATDLMALDLAGKEIRDLPIRIDDTAAVAASAMRTRVRRWSRKRGRVGLVIVDYLQLVGLSRDERREAGGNRVQEVSAITRQLKFMAKDLNVPVLCLAQLNRDVEKREDKRPMLADLRESGSIEQDADVVAFLYREHYYLSQRPPARKERDSDLDFGQRRVEWQTACDRLKDTAELIISKNRHGSMGTLQLMFRPELMLFEDDQPGGAGGEAKAQRAQQLALDIANRID